LIAVLLSAQATDVSVNKATAKLYPVANTPAAMLALAFGYLTCAVNVFFKDMAQIVSICLQFGMWLTPIMYQETMFADKAPWFVTILKLNPFYYVVAGYRDSMLTGNWFWERPKLGIYFWLVIGLVGLRVFKRLRPHFSDVL